VDETNTQLRQWSRHAARYSALFLDPYESGVENPILTALDSVSGADTKTVADLGCGTGPLLPYLARRFAQVIALDFAPGMIERARGRVGKLAENITFLKRPMTELDDYRACFDVVVAVNSLVMPDVRDIDRTLRAIHESLRPGGLFLGVVPAIDAIQYHTMLLFDRALERGLDPEEAERYTAFHAEHGYYDFAFGRFQFLGLQQKFWARFEVEYRLRKSGFSAVEVGQVLYPWDDNVPGGAEFSGQPRSWDWSFAARL
jgi:SAM-dependent methyltransferase